ncbi:hypothetical protein [Bacillus paralicheniformis]|uniref:hypothetical protein n=1 Tax=Bacillus paralicheniformis TaxID=1648923 RepID=UPI002DBC0EA5|nr:hypothetical protein [Bacillus paralicheniformis]MEC1866737.1 hypothetical protein [Bacillus paralicheniformis]
MENIKNNYKALLVEYEEASQFYQRTGLTRLLAHALENLEQFERAFSECYSLRELAELQEELGYQGLMIV